MRGDVLVVVTVRPSGVDHPWLPTVQSMVIPDSIHETAITAHRIAIPPHPTCCEGTALIEVEHVPRLVVQADLCEVVHFATGILAAMPIEWEVTPLLYISLRYATIQAGIR